MANFFVKIWSKNTNKQTSIGKCLYILQKYDIKLPIIYLQRITFCMSGCMQIDAIVFGFKVAWSYVSGSASPAICVSEIASVVRWKWGSNSMLV